MFHFSGYVSHIAMRLLRITAIEFPHSDIAGSKSASRLPDAFRRHATSFITLISLGILHLHITYPSINSITEFSEFVLILYPFCFSTKYILRKIQIFLAFYGCKTQEYALITLSTKFVLR